MLSPVRLSVDLSVTRVTGGSVGGGGSRVAITTRTLTQHGSNSIQVYIFDTYGAYSYDNEMFSICLAVLAKYRQESVPDS